MDENEDVRDRLYKHWYCIMGLDHIIFMLNFQNSFMEFYSTESCLGKNFRQLNNLQSIERTLALTSLFSFLSKMKYSTALTKVCCLLELLYIFLFISVKLLWHSLY